MSEQQETTMVADEPYPKAGEYWYIQLKGNGANLTKVFIAELTDNVAAFLMNKYAPHTSQTVKRASVEFVEKCRGA